MRSHFVRHVPEVDDEYAHLYEISTLNGMNVLADQRHAVSVDDDGVLAIWRAGAEPRGLTKVVTKHHQSLGLVALEDATTGHYGHCLSATTESSVWRWDLQVSRAVHIYDAAAAAGSDLECMLVYADTMVTGGNDKRVSVWPLGATAPLATWRAHEGSVRALAMHDYEVVSAGADRRLCFWDVRRLPDARVHSPAPVRELTTESVVRTLAYAATGRELAIGEGGGRLSRLRDDGSGHVMLQHAPVGGAAAGPRAINAVLYLGEDLLYTQGSDLRVWFNETRRSHYLAQAPNHNPLLSLGGRLLNGNAGVLSYDGVGNLICWMFGNALERLRALSRSGQEGSLAQALDNVAGLHEVVAE